jgi:sulfur carrier protein
MPATIAITANGRRYEVAAEQTLGAFLESVGQKPRLVVVERNGQALTPGEARTTTLADGDVLEIVRVVAGG